MRVINSRSRDGLIVSIFDFPKLIGFKTKAETTCLDCHTQLYVYTKDLLRTAIWIACPTCNCKMIILPPPSIKINLKP